MGIILRIKMVCNNKTAYVLFALRRQAEEDERAVLGLRIIIMMIRRQQRAQRSVVASGFYLLSGCFAQFGQG